MITMAVFIEGALFGDINRGTIAVTTLPGALQVDIVMRLRREDYLLGKSPINCLILEDRYMLAVLSTGQSAQAALGYPAANFIDPAAVGML